MTSITFYRSASCISIHLAAICINDLGISVYMVYCVFVLNSFSIESFDTSIVTLFIFLCECNVNEIYVRNTDVTRETISLFLFA